MLCNSINGWCGGSSCPRCRLVAAHGEKAREIIDRQDSIPVLLPAVPCPHLGEPTGREVECASCRGLVSMPVYHCSRHGLTVIGDRRPKAHDVTACRWCPDRPRQRFATSSRQSP